MNRFRYLWVSSPLVLLAATFLPLHIHAEPRHSSIELAILLPTTAPQVTVQTTSVEISGRASSSSGLPVTVTWTINQKYGGSIESTSLWSAGFINLAPGPNLIEVTATDGVSTPVTRQVALNVEVLPETSPSLESLHFKLGRYRGRLVRYRVINGRAVFEGDIILGDPAALDPMLVPKSAQGVQDKVLIPESLGVALQSSLWPKIGGVAQVPYIVSADTSTGVAAAISAFNTTSSAVSSSSSHGLPKRTTSTLASTTSARTAFASLPLALLGTNKP